MELKFSEFNEFWNLINHRGKFCWCCGSILVLNTRGGRFKSFYCNRCGLRIWSRGGAQLLRPKVADVAKCSRASEASNLQPGSRAHLRALEAFGVLMLKYALSYILETLFLSFLTFDKNRALEFTAINLRHSYILHLFFNLHEKV